MTVKRRCHFLLTMFSKPVPKLPEPTLPVPRSGTSTVVQRELLPVTERVNRQSPECRAFQRCFSILADGVSNPGRLAIQLYSKALIGPHLRTEAQKQAVSEQEKIVVLLSAVENQIVASPATKFREFLDVLQNEPSLQHLATRLESTLSELCTPSVSSPTCMCIPPLMTCSQLNPPLSMSNPCSQHPPHNSCVPIPPTKRPRTDAFSHQHPLEQPSDFQQDHQIPHYPHAQSVGKSSAVDTYASYLKSVYTREKLPIYDKWPQVKSKKYINLALLTREDITKQEAEQFMRSAIHGNIDDIKKSKRDIDIGQIAQLPDGSQPKCILVEGAPGVGKSTFAWMLCRKWGKGKLLQQYQLVVLLRLRDKSVQAAKQISDLFRYHDHQIQQAAVEELQKLGGKGVLLLCEGYDELPEELRTENSVFLDIITGRVLPEATVLITSQPWASEFLHRECKRHISQHIEILGFTKAGIQSYLESITASDPSLLAMEGLKKYISCYPLIDSLMYIPLNAAIVVEVYRNSEKDETLVPKTMTELYSSLVRSLLLRHLLDHPVHGKKRRWRVRSFGDLPQDIYRQLCELCEIAYEGILHRQVIFSDLPEDFETLGLMQCVPELYADEGTVVSYNFLHLTVQEYLAAFHLSQQPMEKQIVHYRKYLQNEPVNSHFNVMLRFLSGVRKFSGYSNEVLNTLCVRRYNFAAECGKVEYDSLHWMFEVQDYDIIAKLLGSSENHVIKPCPFGFVFTNFDIFVLGYCVSHSNCTWIFDFGDCRIGDDGVEMLVRGIVEEKNYSTGGIRAMNLSVNCITSEAVKHLSNIPKEMIKSLRILLLDRNSLASGFCAILSHLISHVPHLNELNLSENEIGHGGAVSLIKSLQTHTSLEKLFLDRTKIGTEDCQALSELLSSSTSLKELDINGNELPPKAVDLIINGLHHNTTLKKLGKSNTRFSLQNVKSLASVLQTNHTLVFLNLGSCSLDSDGACQLANALCKNNTLQYLSLILNQIGVRGAAAFAKTLLKNKSLRFLDLQDDSVGEEGTQKLIDSLTHNTTVKELWLHEKYASLISRSKVDNRVKCWAIARSWF